MILSKIDDFELNLFSLNLATILEKIRNEKIIPTVNVKGPTGKGDTDTGLYCTQGKPEQMDDANQQSLI